MPKTTQNYLQNTLRNDLILVSGENNSLKAWLEAYFKFEVTTLESSQKVQLRDLKLFLAFMIRETGGDNVENWTPRASQAFKTTLKKVVTAEGKRQFNDRTINRVLAHLKTFAKWVHKLRPFPLGNPMEKIKSLPTSNLLNVDRALSPTERHRILDAADLLLTIGGMSKDRHRYKSKDRPQRKDYRPYRNRAIVYMLLETGMRRAAVTKVNVSDVDFNSAKVRTEEKGDSEHYYKISKEGLSAIKDYIDKERGLDSDCFDSPALLLPANTVKQNKSGYLHPKTINEIWNQVLQKADVKGKTPHSARHSMGRHIIEKTGNIAAVQKQLGHKNPTYSMQYARITDEELGAVLENRD